MNSFKHLLFHSLCESYTQGVAYPSASGSGSQQLDTWLGLQSHLKMWLVEYSLLSSLTWLLTGLTSSQAIGSSVAIGQRPHLVLYHMGLSIGQFTTWQLAFLRVSKWGWAHNTEAWPFCYLIWEVTSHHLCCILFLEVSTKFGPH